MRAVRVKGFGDVDQLDVVTLPDRDPGEGEVIIRIEACGLNYADVMQREGLYVGGPKPPFLAGIEAAGTVEASGPGVRVRVGSRVAAVSPGGMQADRAHVRAESCIPLPPTLSSVEGAAFPVQFLTAYHALITVANARERETVLIQAAGGGVGTAAVQIAKLLGLKVVATASTAEKRSRVMQLGADSAVDYDKFHQAAREISNGRGPDIVIETVGGDVFRRSLACLAPFGRLVAVGVSSGSPVQIDALKLLFGSKSVMGFHLDSVFGRADLLESSLTRLMEWITSGKVKAQIGHTLTLSEIRVAHELLASRQSYGKIVLIP